MKAWKTKNQVSGVFSCSASAVYTARGARFFINETGFSLLVFIVESVPFSFSFFFFGFLGFGSLFAWRTRGVAPVGVVGAVDVVDINGALRFGGCGCSERWGGWIRG